MIKILEGIVYTFGVVFIISLFHELYHHFDCGGDFVAGFGHLNGQFVAGRTWCTGVGHGEVVAYLISIVLLLLFIFLRVKSRLH